MKTESRNFEDAGVRQHQQGAGWPRKVRKKHKAEDAAGRPTKLALFLGYPDAKFSGENGE
jgi:hypothetical protein